MLSPEGVFVASRAGGIRKSLGFEAGASGASDRVEQLARPAEGKQRPPFERLAAPELRNCALELNAGAALSVNSDLGCLRKHGCGRGVAATLSGGTDAF